MRVGRLSVTGELGYELNVPASRSLPGVYRLLRAAGDGLDVLPLGYEALDAMRLEKSFGIWSREFTLAYTPGMSGLDRFVAFDKPAFTGRDAALRERDRGADQRLVTLAVDSTDAEAMTSTPSGPVPRGSASSPPAATGTPSAPAWRWRTSTAHWRRWDQLDVHVVGRRTPARVIPDSPHDPEGARPRAQSGDA